jgi:putative transposase
LRKLIAFSLPSSVYASSRLWICGFAQNINRDWWNRQNALSSIVNVVTAIATGVKADGRREILGVDVLTAEDGAAWTSFLRGLVARGLSGIKLVISDDHLGLKQAIAAVLPGAAWQGCRVHFVRNLWSKVPKSAQTLVATLVLSISAQPEMAAV